MALPLWSRLIESMAPQAPDYIHSMMNTLNTFADTVTGLFDRGLVIGTNVQGQRDTFTFTVPSNYTADNAFPTFSYRYTGGGQPQNLTIGRIVDTSGELITEPFAITSWGLDRNVKPPQIVVGFIAGLKDGHQYSVNLIAL